MEDSREKSMGLLIKNLQTPWEISERKPKELNNWQKKSLGQYFGRKNQKVGKIKNQSRIKKTNYRKRDI